jgi:hypothetical protein
MVLAPVLAPVLLLALAPVLLLALAPVLEMAWGLRQRGGKRYCLQVAKCLARFWILICMAFFIFKMVDCSHFSRGMTLNKLDGAVQFQNEV